MPYLSWPASVAKALLIGRISSKNLSFFERYEPHRYVKGVRSTGKLNYVPPDIKLGSCTWVLTILRRPEIEVEPSIVKGREVELLS